MLQNQIILQKSIQIYRFCETNCPYSQTCSRQGSAHRLRPMSIQQVICKPRASYDLLRVTETQSESSLEICGNECVVTKNAYGRIQ